MTQSDSQDFEFDISNLEVEGNVPSASEQEDTVSAGQAVPEQTDAKDVRVDEDEELAGFDIDELPDAFSSQVAESEESLASDSRDESGDIDSAAQTLPRADDADDRRSMRALGEDDLGAEVFEEMASNGEGFSFEAALDELLEEVDGFESGGYIDLDDDSVSSSVAGSDSDLFKLDDPDDSLRRSVRPEAEPTEKKAAAPEASADVVPDEIPADPPISDAAEDSSEEIVVESDPEVLEVGAEEQELDVTEPVSTDAEAPTDAEASTEAEPSTDAEESIEAEATPDEEPVSEAIELEEEQLPSEPEPAAESESEDASPEQADEIASEPEEVAEIADEAVDEADEEDLTAMPTAEDLLMHAGSLFNRDKPAEEASSMLEVLEDEDDDEIEVMPSPQDLMTEASGGADASDDTFAAMSDPQTMMDPEGAEEKSESAAQKKSGSGNVADRGGDLPPPPPAPVEIIDDDPLDEDIEAPIPEEQEEIAAFTETPDLVASPSGESEEAGDDMQDPFASEITLDDFDDELTGSDGFDDILFGDSPEVESQKSSSNVASVAAPKPRLLWRLTHSVTIAAAVVLLAAGWIFSIWKQQIVEYFEGRDIDGSSLIAEIREIGSHALQDFDERGLYRMQWIDGEVRRVATNEIRMYALIGAQLQEDLYKPVHESELEEKFGYDEPELMDALLYAQRNFPEKTAHFPTKPWNALYRVSASKNEILPLRVTYKLTRADSESDWALTSVSVKGHEKELAWPEGEPKYAFGEDAYDIDSHEFEELFTAYRNDSQSFIANVDLLKSSKELKLAELHRENEKRRESIMKSFSQGSFFNGVAILGEDATQAKDVRMIITEMRDDGAFVKGVFQLAGSSEDVSKQFVGSVNFETTLSGAQQGVLNLTTVSIDSPENQHASSRFFNPGSISRMRLEANGIGLEGDLPEFSLRLTRSM